MMELEEFKKFLGTLAKDYNEAQLQELRREMHGIAEILLDLYLAKKKGSKKTSRPQSQSLDSPPKPIHD